MRFTKTKLADDVDKFLSGHKPGDVVTPADIKGLTGLPADDSKCKGWQIVGSLIPRIEKTCGLCWRWDRLRKQWKCLTDAEKVPDINARVRRMNGTAKRNDRVMKTVNFDNLSDDQKRQAVVSGMVSEAVRICTSGQSIKSLTTFAQTTPKLPDPSELMRLFIH